MEHHTRPVGDRINSHKRHVDFGLVDLRGRRMGTNIYTYEETYEEISEDEELLTYFHLAPGHYYFFDQNVTRNGEPYGGSSRRRAFKSPEEREVAIERYLADARKRAAKVGKAVSGDLAPYVPAARVPVVRPDRSRQRAEAARKAAEKLARREARDAKIAVAIPEVEAAVQALLDDADLMDYLKSYPWPRVIPGPPSMAYTAYDHVVVKNHKYVEYEEREGTPARLLAELKTFLRMLTVQRRRRAQGLLPDFPLE